MWMIYMCISFTNLIFLHIWNFSIKNIMIDKALYFQNIILGPSREFVEASFPNPLHSPP